jgi:hypothetical protein
MRSQSLDLAASSRAKGILPERGALGIQFKANGTRLACVFAVILVACSISCGSDDDDPNPIEEIRIRCAAHAGAPGSSAYDTCLQKQQEALLRSQSISVELGMSSPGHELLNTCMIGATESGNVDWVKGLDCYLDRAESDYPRGSVRGPARQGLQSGFWGTDSAKADYVDLCARSLIVEGMDEGRSRESCDCLALELSSEFKRHEYEEVLGTQPDPDGDDYDRLMFRIMSHCMSME